MATEAVSKPDWGGFAFTQRTPAAASDSEVVLASTTDSEAAATAALEGGDEEAARVPPSPKVKTEITNNGRTVSTSYEGESQERAKWLEEARREAEELAESTEEAGPGGEAAEEQTGELTEEETRAIRQAALQDAINGARAAHYQQWAAEHLGASERVAAVAGQQYAAAMAQAQHNFATRVQAVLQKLPDAKGLREAADQIRVEAPLTEALLGIEGGEHVYVHLARHPELAESLQQLPPEIMAARVGQLAAELKPRPQQAQSLHPSKKLQPMLPVSGSIRAKPSLTDEDIDYATWRKLRDEQIKHNYRR